MNFKFQHMLQFLSSHKFKNVGRILFTTSPPSSLAPPCLVLKSEGRSSVLKSECPNST